MQDFDFSQIQSNLPKANQLAQISLQFYSNFAQTSQICPNFIKFAKKNLLGMQLYLQFLFKLMRVKF